MKNITLLITFLFLLLSAQGLAQNIGFGSDSMIVKVDTMKQYLNTLQKKNKATSADNNIFIEQNKILKSIKEKSDIGKAILSRGVDSASINWELQSIVQWNDIASEGIFDTEAKFVLKSNLNVSSIIFRELLTRTQNIQDRIQAYRTELETIQIGIDSLIVNDALYQMPKDTSEVLAYLLNVRLVVEEAVSIADQTKKVLNNIQKQELLTSVLKYDLEGKLSKAETIQSEQIGVEDWKDFENFTQFLGSQKNIREIINYSATKVFFAAGFYLYNHINLVSLIILLIVGMFFYLKMLKKNLSEKTDKTSALEYYAFKHPFFISIVVVVTVLQYFFGAPPFPVYAGLWGISFWILVFLRKNNLDKIWFRWMLMLGGLYLLAYFDYMILLQHTLDKILVLILAILSIALGITGWRYIKRSETKLDFMKGFLIYFIIMEFLSLILNLFDHFGASKRLMVIGILGMVLIILIRLTLEILYKVFSLSLEVFKKTDDGTLTINLTQFNSPTPKYYSVIGFIAWLYMFIHFFYILQLIIQPISDFFTTNRSIGSFVFTFEGILLFVSIIFISTLVSKMLSYLLADSKVLKDRTKGKKGIELGSWVLLLRIGIISIGLLIAFASAGIPLDRITIIISALSVGIGFGMQTLINNLVSGIIIAFEKPVNVGDVVEVAGKTGRMKSIGVRSSMVTTWDGSDVVIPNGDLLNQHLTNWTLGNSYARFAIIVGVAYGTNLEEAHALVVDLLRSRNDVLKYPQPLITFTEFGSSSIDLAIKFWVADYSTGVTVKSDLIIAIDKLFKEKNISIPFPQQDVYVKSLPGKSE